jgi:hypothetical protein
MTGVMLGQSAVPTFLFTVHGHVRPIGGNGRRGKAPRGSPPCQRAPRVPRARQKYAKEVGRSRAYVARNGRGGNRSRQGAEVGCFDDVMRLGRGGNYRSRRLSRPRPFRKARVGRRLASGLERLTCCQRL